MVFIWGSGWGGRRRRRGYGPPPGYGPGYGYGPAYGPGYGAPGWGYRRSGGSCLRDLLLLDAGCCIAESLGCGGNGFLLAPSTLRAVRRAGGGAGRSHGMAERMVAAIRVYQREISPHRTPCCRFTPSCSAYGVQAIQQHGAARGGWLTLRRLLRCRPGGPRGADPVPAARLGA
jgi:putative membrane protein insertion efficiency factor